MYLSYDDYSIRFGSFFASAIFTTIGELLYIRSPAINRALCVLILACFFLWIRFLLCWTFLFCWLILPGSGVFFRHTFKFKVSELFTHGCRVFSSRFSMLSHKKTKICLSCRKCFAILQKVWKTKDLILTSYWLKRSNQLTGAISKDRNWNLEHKSHTGH